MRLQCIKYNPPLCPVGTNICNEIDIKLKRRESFNKFLNYLDNVIFHTSIRDKLSILNACVNTQRRQDLTFSEYEIALPQSFKGYSTICSFDLQFRKPLFKNVPHVV